MSLWKHCIAHVLVACTKLHHTPLLQHLGREELVSLSEIDVAITLLSWCEMTSWTDIVDLYELNQQLLEGLEL
jgi:hypothetical protein